MYVNENPILYEVGEYYDGEDPFTNDLEMHPVPTDYRNYETDKNREDIKGSLRFLSSHSWEK
ncbi:MAG: hypothetical protein Q8M92_01565 [Candidatus Subteraquimicrobiales bacterium]|nr:hypothetical protein [Candidatus Subteraquimicrobiales bacterium]